MDNLDINLEMTNNIIIRNLMTIILHKLMNKMNRFKF